MHKTWENIIREVIQPTFSQYDTTWFAWKPSFTLWPLTAVELKCHSRVSRVWSLNVAQPLNLSLNKITNEEKHSFITGHWWWTHWDRDGCSLHKTFTVLCLGQTVTHVTTSTCWIRLRMTETKCTRPVPECTPSSWCTPVQSWVYTCTHITIRYV